MFLTEFIQQSLRSFLNHIVSGSVGLLEELDDEVDSVLNGVIGCMILVPFCGTDVACEDDPLMIERNIRALDGNLNRIPVTDSEEPLDGDFFPLELFPDDFLLLIVAVEPLGVVLLDVDRLVVTNGTVRLACSRLPIENGNTALPWFRFGHEIPHALDASKISEGGSRMSVCDADDGLSLLDSIIDVGQIIAFALRSLGLCSDCFFIWPIPWSFDSAFFFSAVSKVLLITAPGVLKVPSEPLFTPPKLGYTTEGNWVLDDEETLEMGSFLLSFFFLENNPDGLVPFVDDGLDELISCELWIVECEAPLA